MLIQSPLNSPVLSSALPADWPGANFWTHWVFYTVVIITVVLLFVMGFIYLERPVSSIQKSVNSQKWQMDFPVFADHTLRTYQYRCVITFIAVNFQ